MKWRFPTPHEVLGAIVVIAYAVLESSIFPVDGKVAKVCNLVMMIAAISGIRSASKFFPDRVKAVLQAHDEDVKAALSTTEKSPTVPQVPPALKPPPPPKPKKRSQS